MLDLLVKYAMDQGLEPEPGFKPKVVKWAICCDDQGRFLEVVELGSPDQKKNPGQTFGRCPDLTLGELIAGGLVRSHFLVETAEVVALYGLKGQSLDEPTNRRKIDKHHYYVKLLQDATHAVPDLGKAADCLADQPTLEQIRNRLENQKAKPTDKVTLRVGSTFPVESDEWHDWWRSFRETLSEPGDPTAKMTCFVTGEFVEPQRTHFKIEKLADVGGQPSGDVLIGFDKEAFCSYGLSQSANAAVSEQAAAAYRSGLNDLLSKYGQRLGGAKVVHWFKEKVAAEDDPLPWLLEGPEQQKLNAQELAKRLLQSIRDGTRSDLQQNRYYALTLSGAAGRVMVRDWMEGQFEDLVRNICWWFEDLAIVDFSGAPAARPPGLERVVTSLLAPRRPGKKYEDWIKPVGPAREWLWHAAVRSDPIPQFALAQALIRARADIVEDQHFNNARMGLMKAYHVRRDRLKGGDTMTKDLKQYLNENHPDPAYQCGRLMAVLSALQRRALPEVGAGVVQRYYAAASSTPSLVLGRLTRLSQFHLNKLEGGLAHCTRPKFLLSVPD